MRKRILSLATIYFPRPAICGEYRRRQFVSQSCSEWEGVVPNHISHQTYYYKAGYSEMQEYL